jgi:hypothetical protein
VDRINHLRREGRPRDAAIREAGPHRLRPILMTSLTLVAGLLPVAMKWGEGGELRAPLAAVIVGGMITSTLLSLVFVPVSYTYFDALQRLPARIVAAVGRRLVPGAHPTPAAAPDGALAGSAATLAVSAGREPPAVAPRAWPTAPAAARFGRGAALAPIAGGAGFPLTPEAAADYLAGVARRAQGQPPPASPRVDRGAPSATPENC